MSHVDGKHWVPTSNQSQLAGGEKRGLLGGNVKRRKVSRKDKVSVGFDSEDRTEYLTGFKKRKDERRAVAIQEMIMKERKDRLEERRKRRKDTKEMLASKGITAGVPSIVLDTGGAGKVEEKNTYESTEQLVTVTAFSLNSDDDDEEDGEEPTAGPEHEQRQPRLKGRSVEAEKQKFRIPNVIGKGKNQIRLNGKGHIKKRSAQPKQRAKKGERKGVGFKGSAGPTGGSDSKKKKKKK